MADGSNQWVIKHLLITHAQLSYQHSNFIIRSLPQPPPLTKCTFCTITKYQDTRYCDSKICTYHLCENHVEVTSTHNTVYYIVKGITRVYRIESNVNVGCEYCSARQYKCLAYPYHHRWRLCIYHLNWFEYRCPSDTTPLVPAWDTNLLVMTVLLDALFNDDTKH